MADGVRTRERVELLRAGETQWGHAGRHHGPGTHDCPRALHHHHDIKCLYPTKEECDMAGVPWREPRDWGRR